MINEYSLEVSNDRATKKKKEGVSIEELMRDNSKLPKTFNAKVRPILSDSTVANEVLLKVQVSF